MFVPFPIVSLPMIPAIRLRSAVRSLSFRRSSSNVNSATVILRLQVPERRYCGLLKHGEIRSNAGTAVHQQGNSKRQFVLREMGYLLSDPIIVDDKILCAQVQGGCAKNRHLCRDQGDIDFDFGDFGSDFLSLCKIRSLRHE